MAQFNCAVSGCNAPAGWLPALTKRSRPHTQGLQPLHSMALKVIDTRLQGDDEVSTRRLMGMAAVLCAAPVFVMAAVVPAALAPSDGMRPTAKAAAHAIDTPDAAGDTVADSHLLLQYALHRSSRYLYNPGDGAQLAGAAGHLETVEHQ